MKLKYIAFLLIVATVVLADDKPKIFSNEIVAVVNGKIITKNDLLLSYESSLSTLKYGATSKERIKNYLNLMIDEFLLAEEGYRLGLDQNITVAKSKKILEKELIIEELIERRLKPKIKVTDEEVKEALNKNKVSFKLGFWLEPTLENAGKVKVEAEKIENSMKLKNSNPEGQQFFTLNEQGTNYLTWLELPEEIFEGIKNLPVNKISEPIPFNGSYFLFRVKDIRREAITENDYLSKAPSIKKILLGKRTVELVTAFVDSLMTPQKVTVKREVFDLFAEVLIAWRNNPNYKTKTFDDFLSNEAINNTLLEKLNNKSDNPFALTKDRTFSLKEFLEIFEADKILPSIIQNSNYKSIINNQVAQTIRDYFMVKEAISLGYNKSVEVKNKLKKWTDKWVYEQYRIEIQKSITRQEKTYKDYPLLVRNQLSAKANEAKKSGNVIVNEIALDSLSVIESEKSRWLTTQFYKAGTNRPIVPMLDPIWSYKNSNDIN